MAFKKDKEKTTIESQAFNEQLLDMLKGVEDALDNESPQTIEVRGAAIHLKAAIGALAQAGKFAKVKS